MHTWRRTWRPRRRWQQPGRKKKKLAEFWREFFFDYWRKFPWRMGLDVDPPADDDLPEVPFDVEAAFLAPDADLDENQQQEKSEIQTKTKEVSTPLTYLTRRLIIRALLQKIKRWFSRQRPKAMGMYGNPYFAYLAELRARNDDPRPRKPTEYHFYMQHADFKDKVSARFEEEHSNAPVKQHLMLCCKLAIKMLEEEPNEVKEKLREERLQAHKKAKEEYEAADDGLPSCDPKVQKE